VNLEEIFMSVAAGIFRRFAFLVLPALGVATAASAQDYPAKPIRLIVPLAAGGIADNLARTFGQKLNETTKQPVVVDNRPGAGSVIGSEMAAKAPPDGYTLLMGGQGPMVMQPLLRAKMPFDPQKDLVAISQIATFANFLVAHPSVPASSLKDLIALAKTRPGALSLASQGPGSSGHVVGEQFKQAAGIDLLHVPYNGAAPAVAALIGGQVHMMFDSVMVSMPQVKSGKLKALAITSSERFPLAPDVPTIAELGFPNVVGGVWFGLFAPAKTPQPIIDFLARESRRIFNDPEIRGRLTSQGATLNLDPPDVFMQRIASESERWGQILRTAGIKPE
jgi:tripartite-type tricarboxylate transporter receptor subunit TctC